MRRRRRELPEIPTPPADVPIELAGVPTVTDVQRAAGQIGVARRANERRNAIRTLLGGSGGESKRMKQVDEALVAAAMIMDPTALDSPAPNAVTRTWQHAANGYVNTVGELNAGRMYVGNALSRCTLAVGKRNPDGSVEQGYDGEEPVDGLDLPVAEEAADLISSIKSVRGGQSELLRSSGEKLFVSGELYYVPQDTPQGMMFDILSTQELLRDGVTWTKYLGPGYGAEPLPEGVNPIRVWRPDGQWSMLATSSVRSCMEILEELVVLTRLVRSSAISRMALAGMLFIPDELDTPDDEVGPDGGMAEATNPLAVDMINTGAKAIDDPANASAWMPFIVQGPAEYGQHIRHIAFEAASQEQVIERTEALQRLAQGLDLPVEVILGHQSTTFTNAQQISIDTFRIHLEPTLQLICDALTVAYLWPAMAKNRGINPEHLAAGEPYPDDVLSVAVTYDAHHLISLPDRAKDLIEIFTHDPTQSSIQIAELRDAVNLDPDQVVDPQEIAARVDAVRLTKIRETIQAPVSDAAVGIQSIDKAVVPGESAGADLIETIGTEESRTASAELALAYRIHGAIEVTVDRSVEKLGARVRAKAKPADRAEWAAIPSAALAAFVGPDRLAETLGSDLDACLRPESTSLASHAADWAAAADIPLPLVIGQRIGDLAQSFAMDRIRTGSVNPVPMSAVCELLAIDPVG